MFARTLFLVLLSHALLSAQTGVWHGSEIIGRQPSQGSSSSCEFYIGDGTLAFENLKISVVNSGYRTANVTFVFTPTNHSSRTIQDVKIGFQNWSLGGSPIPMTQTIHNIGEIRPSGHENNQSFPVTIEIPNVRLSSDNQFSYYLVLREFYIKPNQQDKDDFARLELEKIQKLEREKQAMEERRQQKIDEMKHKDDEDRKRIKETEATRLALILKQPLNFQKSLRNHEVMVGMNELQVKLAFGDPLDINKIVIQNRTQVVWSFLRIVDGFPKRVLVGFVNGRVVLVTF